MAPEQFSYVSELVQQRSGIRLEAGKEYLVEARLASLARTAGHGGDIDGYVRHLRHAGTGGDLTAVVEALTTNETSFFRDATPFTALRERIVPDLRARGLPDRVKIWSAACSTGQEPYSIAMTMLEILPTTPVDILATDLNTEVLAKARAGLYSKIEVNRGMPAPMLVRHFRTAGSSWQVNDTVRAMVRFEQHNLLTTPPPGGPFDIVFLRNVLIYFDAPTKASVLDRVARVVRPGGFLVLGGAESTLGLGTAWERVTSERAAICRRTTAGAVSSLPPGGSAVFSGGRASPSGVGSSRAWVGREGVRA